MLHEVSKYNLLAIAAILRLFKATDDRIDRMYKCYKSRKGQIFVIEIFVGLMLLFNIKVHLSDIILTQDQSVLALFS